MITRAQFSESHLNLFMPVSDCMSFAVQVNIVKYVSVISYAFDLDVNYGIMSRLTNLSNTELEKE